MPGYLDRAEWGEKGGLQLFNPCLLVRGGDPGDSALIDPFDLLHELAVRLLFIVVLAPRRVAPDSDLVRRCYIEPAGRPQLRNEYLGNVLFKGGDGPVGCGFGAGPVQRLANAHASASCPGTLLVHFLAS